MTGRNLEHFLKIPGNQTAEEWIDAVAARTEPLGSCIAATLNPDIRASDVLVGLFENANRFRTQCIDSGISAPILNDLYDRWNELVAVTRDRFIPQGASEPHIEAFLRHECILGPDGESMLMLASHPIRARWIAKYLEKSEELAIKALNAELPLNSQNELLYLNWIGNLSPHQNPAVHVAPNGEPLLATREEGWTEEYSPLRQSSLKELSESIPASSLIEIARQITTYLEAHPYKRDGLSILIVSPGAPRLPAELAEMIRKGEWRDAKLTIHFATPRAHWERAISFIEKVPSEKPSHRQGCSVSPVATDASRDHRWRRPARNPW